MKQRKMSVLASVALICAFFFGIATAECPGDCSCKLATDTELNCTNLALPEVPNDIWSNITDLQLQNNNISTITNASFTELSSLKNLSLGFNEISSISYGAFQNQTSLEILQLNNNSLTSLDGYLGSSLGNLINLDVSNNNLQRIGPKDLEQLKSLKTLNLSGNNISSIDDGAFTNSSSLESLNLQNNGLESIGEWITKVPKEANLTLLGNPFICTCELINMTNLYPNRTKDVSTCRNLTSETDTSTSLSDWESNCPQAKSGPTPTSQNPTTTTATPEDPTAIAPESTTPAPESITTTPAPESTTNTTPAPESTTNTTPAPESTTNTTTPAPQGPETTPETTPESIPVVQGNNYIFWCQKQMSSGEVVQKWTFNGTEIDLKKKEYSVNENKLTVVAVMLSNAGKYCCEGNASSPVYCEILDVKKPPTPTKPTSPAIYVAVVFVVVFVVALVSYCAYKKFRDRGTESYGLLSDPSAFRPTTEDRAFRHNSDDYL